MVNTVNWIRRVVRLASVLLFIGVLSAAAAPVRVAIIGDSGERGTEAGVAAMLVAQLSAHKDIALVEREQIQKALDEQGLTVAGFVGADAAVATGQLLAVDLFAAIETLRLKPHDSLLRSGRSRMQDPSFSQSRRRRRCRQGYQKGGEYLT